MAGRRVLAGVCMFIMCVLVRARRLSLHRFRSRRDPACVSWPKVASGFRFNCWEAWCRGLRHHMYERNKVQRKTKNMEASDCEKRRCSSFFVSSRLALHVHRASQVRGTPKVYGSGSFPFSTAPCCLLDSGTTCSLFSFAIERDVQSFLPWILFLLWPPMGLGNSFVVPWRLRRRVGGFDRLWI